MFIKRVISADLRQLLSVCSDFVSRSGTSRRKRLRARGTSYARAITVPLVLAAVSTVGCGGGSGSGTANANTGTANTGGSGSSAAPQISNLTYPNSIAENSNGTVTLSGTLNFTDNGGGLATLNVTVLDANGRQLSTFSNPIAGLGGQASGTLSATIVLTVTGTGTFTFQISVTDANGSKSNELTGTIQVVYPVPALQSVSPISIPINSPDTVVTIRGSGIVAASTMQVNGGTQITQGGFIPATGSYFFTVPAADLTAIEPLSITVSNPGTAASNALTINVTANPVPSLSFLSPAAAGLGGPEFTLTVSGTNFAPSSVVQWNGVAQPTTFVASGQLKATISAQDIQALANNTVTVFTPAPGGGTSGGLPFTTFVALPANDLVYSSTTQMLYASAPSSAGASLGNSIVPIDPNTGTIGTPINVGSEPGKMALSSDGTVIWVALNGAGAVRKVDLIAKTAGLQFSLGGGTGIYNPPSVAQALAVMPGSPNTVAVAASVGFAYQSAVTIYDNGVARTNAENGAVQCCSGVTGLAFDPTGTNLYEVGAGYGIATVDSTGITSATSLNSGVSSNALRVDSGRAYLTSGVVLDANLGTQLGIFSAGQGQSASGPVAPDSGVGEAFVLLNTFPSSMVQVNAYDISSFVLKGSLTATIAPSNGPSGTPSLTRWGQNGLAFSDGAQLYIFQSPLVQDLSSSRADVSVTASAPSSATTGTTITYMLTVSNSGPQAATPVTLIDDLPNGVAFQTAAPSQGSCSGAPIVWCDLGSLNSGSSATVQITATALSAGTLSNTASASAPQGDPNLANNTVTSMTAVSGPGYSPNPAVSSISPAFVPTGSASFTLTVNGSGFVSGSEIQLNSSALTTTFVNGSELTASVPASDVASLGWAWINVVNPMPGGGSSGSLPLTVYRVVSLDVNHMGFDAFTRKLYASIPSTATQVTGNSLVAIDPLSGSIGTPLNIGSEPNRVAESSDGQYLYVGLDGSKSVTWVNLTSMTQGPVFPITVGQNAQVAARDLAVAPGNDNLLAIDTGSSSGIGLFDISGSTGTMRPNLTGIYTGSVPTFANPSLLYSYDIDTSAAEFYRWDVTSTGFAKHDNTGFTLSGIGGFSGGFRLSSGLVYGFAGGVADPTTTPPTQLGQFPVSSLLGFGQTVEGSGVAPDPVEGRVFLLGETLAGSANPVLASYDSARYVPVNMQTFTGLPEGEDLIRWGRDGLAWHTSLGGGFGGSSGTGKVILVRGPFVLPAWNTVNATPGLTSATPSSVTAGSGNVVLAIAGSGFVPGAVVTWNGAERTTTFVDSSDLTVAIPASDLSQSGTATLTVNNPGSADSNPITFAIN